MKKNFIEQNYMHTQFKNGGRGISFFMADHVFHGPVKCLTHFKLKNTVLNMLTCSIIYFLYLLSDILEEQSAPHPGYILAWLSS